MIYRCAQAQGSRWRVDKRPAVHRDVPEWAYESVAWCYMNSVTTGVSTSFRAGQHCTCAKIVTFLWRAFGK